MEIPVSEWLEPWELLVPSTVEAIADELAREVGPGHPLWQVRAVPVARRCDRDDVLFVLPEHEPSLVVVHLTWSMAREPAAFPSVQCYADWSDWIESSMKPDHEEYNREA